jgi:TonB family protein
MDRSLSPCKVWLLLLLSLFLSLATQSTYGQEGRKPLLQPPPSYPQMARRMALAGTVKIEIVIGTVGQIKNTKVLGGHPLFVDATLDALKKWKYVPAITETTMTLEFNFHP